MSYEPTNWKDGDLVTSAKLNKIEQGIAAGSGILIAHRTDSKETSTLDKTWQEIHDADVCYIIQHDDEYSDCKLVIETGIAKGNYVVDVFDFTSPLRQTFYADSPNGTLALTINEPVA